MSKCRLCEVDLSKVNVRYHYSRNHDTKPTYDELYDEVLGLEEMIASLRDVGKWAEANAVYDMEEGVRVVMLNELLEFLRVVK